MSLAARKQALVGLILVIGVLVIGAGAFVLSKEGLLFLFGERAATSPNSATLTGIIRATASSRCYSIMPSEYKTVPYVLEASEGQFPVLSAPATVVQPVQAQPQTGGNGPTTLPKGVPPTQTQAKPGAFIISDVEAASAPSKSPTYGGNVAQPVGSAHPTVNPTSYPTNPPPPNPTPTPVSVINYSFTTNCRPVYATAAQIGKLLNQRVVIYGQMRGLILYLQTISASPAGPVQRPTQTSRPVPTRYPTATSVSKPR